MPPKVIPPLGSDLTVHISTRKEPDPTQSPRTEPGKVLGLMEPEIKGFAQQLQAV